MGTSKLVKPHHPHPTPHTLPPGKTFCRKPYLQTLCHLILIFAVFEP
ncbi:hypothetical protein [Microcystis sp. LE19-41.2A]|nr:hypothetical protein [Microcystis sp. LE19-41.2A]